ncbi:DUF58 domain-containing protein [Nakamurella alba]|uniref:DUF58 domain-containing protein n=1 Tax=Nakamurella alba TaxID=2665158 RepID=UPI001E657006|nr:DUF58 domain-containing protein [Nakamurella alba]
MRPAGTGGDRRKGSGSGGGRPPLDAAGITPGSGPGGSAVSPLAPSTADPARLDAALATLEITVRRRLDGLLQGNHLGLVPGPGSEPGDARPYYPGDDVRRMDWSVTARTTEAHIRQTVADRELETWIVADLSGSLDFGTAGCEKRDLVVAAAAAIGHLTRGGGNRLGAIIATGDGTTRVPARGGAAHLQALLRTLASTPRSEVGSRGDLQGAIEQLRRPPRRRGLAVVISDFLGEMEPSEHRRSERGTSGERGAERGGNRPFGGEMEPSEHRRSERGTSGDRGAERGGNRPFSAEAEDGKPTWERSLRALSGRHDLLAVEVLDPRDVELPAVGTVTLVDPESGRTKEVQTTGALRASFAEAASAHREQVAAALRRAGAAQLTLRTDRDWVADVLRFVLSRKRGWSGNGTSGSGGNGPGRGDRQRPAAVPGGTR